MRRLLLLRHTKSDWPAGIRDRDRPLAARGRRAAPLMGRVLVERGLIPDRVLVSTAKRTTETWALARAGHGELPDGIGEPRIYEAPAFLLATVVRETPEEVATLLVVGHNPGMEDLAFELVGSGEAAARARLSRKYPTGGLAVIACAIDSWRDLARHCGRLEAFVVPRDLDDEAE